MTRHLFCVFETLPDIFVVFSLVDFFGGVKGEKDVC